MPRHKKNYSRPKGKKFYNKTTHNAKKTHVSKGETLTNRKRKNFQFIKRNKDSVEFQRRQKLTEDKYKQQTALNTVDEESSLDESQEFEDESPFESLLSTFKTTENQRNEHLESSSDEDIGEEEEDDVKSLEGEDEDIGLSEGDELDDGEELGYEERGLDNEEDKCIEGEGEDGEDKKNKQNEDEVIAEEELDEDVDNLESKCSLADSFSIHLDNELEQEHVDNLLAKPSVTKKSKLNWGQMGYLQIEISKSKQVVEQDLEPNKKKKYLLLDSKLFASEGCNPQCINWSKENLKTVGIKVQLANNVNLTNKNNLKSSLNDYPLSPLQTELFSIFNNYQDLFYSQRTLENAEEIRFVYCLHVLNHMLKTRSKILHHNAKLSAAALTQKTLTIIPDSYRDQCLVRPKVLIILPFRESVYKVVNFLICLLYGEKSDISKTNGTVINYKRFEEEYTGDTLYFPKTNPKPDDYEKTFAGNTDDNFRIGISLTKKCIKLYTEFYSSDILIASPLGLRMVIGAPGDVGRDYDFLTSIELLILDQAELFLAQNWDHLLHVLDHMHLQPQSVRNTDFSRVRPWCLNGLSRFYRQTLLFTSHELPEFRSLFNSKCSNYRGKVRTANPIVDGSIRTVFVQIPQIFHKVEVTSLEDSFDMRFKYFVNEILPQFKGASMAHCMLYVPSYFDYVRLRNYFKAETVNFVQICEYTKDGKIARARDMFYHSGAHFLLYSERAHFFRRTRIKGIRHLIMYQPPCWPNFYPEIINLMQEGNQNSRDGLETSMSVTVLYTKYDLLQISSIIGTDRASKMMQSRKTTHIFSALE